MKWLFFSTITLLMAFIGWGGYLNQKEKQLKKKLERLKKAEKNMENHCATDKDWELIINA